jgi:penicillin-binding protein 1A
MHSALCTIEFMRSNRKASFFSSPVAKILIGFTLFVAGIIGVGLGFALAATVNTKNNENFVEFAPALPTRILDINGTVITEFSADEKREMVSLNELPRHLIYAVLAREDPEFFHHKGFSVRGIGRALYGQIIGRSLGGGSTITQQVAGTLYTNRREYTWRRKIIELWWALQLERRYTKNEILEIYLNYMVMGPGVYGVEAASKYFFGHSARDISIAEAAVLAVQLSSPTRHNPLSRPDTAMDRQRRVLDRMVELGYTTREEAEASFSEYWSNYDYTRAATAAYYHREDKAPWFSEYVRRELSSLMYGTMDYYRDGYTVHTTLNLQHQEAAEKFMGEGFVAANREFQRSLSRNNLQAIRTYIPIVNLLTLGFDLNGIHAMGSAQNEQRALSQYTRVVNPVVDMLALAFDVQDIKPMSTAGYGDLRQRNMQNVVEGALISIEAQTGYITALVGGSKFDETNQFIRATQGEVQPGSSFKPLYFSAALDLKQFTAAALIYDMPIVFHNEDGTLYIPNNFGGAWGGPVLMYSAMAHSLNIPFLKVLDTIGFDAAIDRAAALLDVTNPSDIRRMFPRLYPLGLGVSSVSPMRMARAFAVFGNEGREVTPMAIRSIDDRNGRVVLDLERDLRVEQRRSGNVQVISPQTAYIMTKMLEKTITEGSLAYGAGYGAKFTFKDENGKSFKMPVAGKTGTSQNWADAWAIGYTPYYSTAVWFGFDRPGNSLGVSQTGAVLSGPIWGDFMREIHQGLPYKEFARPAVGIVDVTVCAKSGLLRTPDCNEGSVTLPFLAGTQPARLCDIHGSSARTAAALPPMQSTLGTDDNAFLDSLMPSLPEDILSDPPNSRQVPNSRTIPNAAANPQRLLNNNPLLDGDIQAEYPEETETSDTSATESADSGGLEVPSYNPLLD